MLRETVSGDQVQRVAESVPLHRRMLRTGLSRGGAETEKHASLIGELCARNAGAQRRVLSEQWDGKLS